TKLLKVFRSEFVPITPGTGSFPKKFTMGSVGGAPSERPPHDVTMSSEFSMACYELPQNLYAVVMGRNPSAWKGPRNSVEMVTWNEAVKFCRETTKLMREAKLIEDDDEIRLPSEAEWEYCCRAGTTTEFSFGDSATGPGDIQNAASILDQYAWHTGNAAGNDPPVGAKKPNAWGLYDMHGYLWEFVSDGWHATYDDAPANSEPWKNSNPSGIRVMRGGSWRDRHELLRSATRWPIPDHARSEAIGFRCVKAKAPRSSQ
ncbi:MAG: formylglycine-generating enzyme family protein, partial [Planctomycetaceae bacterium]